MKFGIKIDVTDRSEYRDCSIIETFRQTENNEKELCTAADGYK